MKEYKFIKFNKDNPPKENEEVVTLNNEGCKHLCKFQEGEWIDTYNLANRTHEVTHYLYFPEEIED